MKKLLFILPVFLTLFAPKVAAQFEGTFGMGIHAGYGAEIASVGAGAHMHYYRTNNLRFAPAFTYYLERKGHGLWTIDSDIHYVIPATVSASLYPIAGVHYSNWKYNNNNESWNKHRIGGNLGIGLQHDISYRVRANFELKYQFIKDFSQVLFTAGIGFWL